MHWWDRQDASKRRSAWPPKSRTTAVKSIFETELAMLELIRTSLISDKKVERQEFQRYSRSVPFPLSDSIEAVEVGLGQLRTVTGRNLEATRAHEESKAFASPSWATGRLVDARRRDECSPILFIGPTVKDKAVYGYDVASRADSLGIAPISPRHRRHRRQRAICFHPGQNFGVIGFLVCLPVYRIDKPSETVANRGRISSDFWWGIFRPADMIGAALEKLQPQGIDISLYDFIGRGHQYAVLRPRLAGPAKTATITSSRTACSSAMALKYSTPSRHFRGSLDDRLRANPQEFYAEHKTAWPWVVCCGRAVRHGHAYNLHAVRASATR